MAEMTLIARVRADEEQPGTWIVASPVVGMADGAPKENLFLNPLDEVVMMKILGRRYVLRLPRDRQGRITDVFIPNEYTAVAFDQPLVRLDPRVAEGLAAAAAGAGDASATGGGPAADLITIKAPSEGIFYRRATPEAPPYVVEGAEIATGAVLGLVEVMKCFNQIAYGGPGFPDRAKVIKILAEDAAEVSFGQPLFSVEPVE